MLDITDYDSIPESFRYLLKIFKEKGEDGQDMYVDSPAVVQYLQEREEETGENISTLFQIEKAAGNPLFKHVTNVEKGLKYLHEVQIYLFVDYSLSDESVKI